MFFGIYKALVSIYDINLAMVLSSKGQ